LSFASALLLVAVTAAPAGPAPMAEVWPYQAKRLPTGALEYSYDLSLLKQKGGTPDAIAAWGDAKVKEFLKALPREAKVQLKPGNALTLGIGRAAETAALVNSMAGISDAALVSSDPLAKTPGARLRPALHPEEPKLLLSTEAVLWRIRRLAEGSEAAILLDNEKLHASLWGKIAERALARQRTANGDAKEGAATLAGRLYAAGSCLDNAKVPAAARAVTEISEAIDAELTAARADPDTVVPTGIFGWSKELGCARVRTRMLAQPFPHSRAGAAAALTLLGLLQADPKLNAIYEQLRARRDAVLLAPAQEGLIGYRDRTAGKVDDALENMAAFIDALGETLPPVPPPFEPADSSFGKFLSELEGAARGSAFDELMAAAQDKRLPFPSGEVAPVMPRYEAAISAMVVEEGIGPQVDAAWRDRRAAGFAALAGGTREHRFEGSDPVEKEEERSALKVRLLLPPTLEVEPAPRAYGLAAEALDRLVAVTTKLSLTALTAVQPEGGRSGEPIVAEAKRLMSALRGLAVISGSGGEANEKDLAEARRFLAGWRTDPSFTRDVREARAFPVNQGSQREHAAIIGIARCELLVGFGAKPATDATTAGPFDVVGAEQRYLVPVMITRGALAKSTAPAMDRAALKLLCEGAKRQPNEIEAALIDAMQSK
jgi:hypothetical protein